MLDLLARLTAIKSYAKDIHYNSSGESFYSIHLLMDRICENLDDFSDSINEVYYLGSGQLPPSSKEVLKLSIAYIPSIFGVEYLKNLISTTVGCLDMLRTTERADNSLLDSIAQDLKLKLGLLNRQTA